MNVDYDYIITGAGAAGLSLLMHMFEQPFFNDKKILLVDVAPKTANDRTWCFWEQQPGLFEKVVYRRWQRMHFFSNQWSKLLQLEPYTYKMIRGRDFYTHCFETIARHTNVTVLYARVEAVANHTTHASATVEGKTYYSRYVFNSIVFAPPVVPKGKYYLQQHFKGWVIKTAQPVFDPGVATLMDFRVSQHHGTTFVYVMPLHNNTALVEYTLFTRHLLPPGEYNAQLEAYITRLLGIRSFQVEEEEFGVIPMTNLKFSHGEGCLVHLGTAGGQTKASSGYTFSFIQKHSARVVQALTSNTWPVLSKPVLQKRFDLYDSTLLNILHHNKLGGDEIFSRLFRHNSPATIFRFLDNESTLANEWQIMRSVPAGIFARAALHEMIK